MSAARASLPRLARGGSSARYARRKFVATSGERGEPAAARLSGSASISRCRNASRGNLDHPSSGLIIMAFCFGAFCSVDQVSAPVGAAHLCGAPRGGGGEGCRCARARTRSRGICAAKAKTASRRDGGGIARKRKTEGETERYPGPEEAVGRTLAA